MKRATVVRPAGKLKRAKSTKASARKSPVGARLVKSLRELRDALASGALLEKLGSSSPGHLKRLVVDGEASIEREGTVSADEVFSALRERARAAREGEAPAKPDCSGRIQA